MQEDGSRSALNPPVTLRRDRHRTACPQGGQEPPVPPAGSKVNVKIQISDPNDSPKAPAASASSAVALRFSTGPNVRGGRPEAQPPARSPAPPALPAPLGCPGDPTATDGRSWQTKQPPPGPQLPPRFAAK